MILRFDDERPGRGFKKSDTQPTGTLFVGSIPYAADEQGLREAFGEFGKVKRVTIGTTPQGLSRGYAHIQFESVEDAIRVMEADQEDPIYIGDRDIFLDHAAVHTSRSVAPNHTLFLSSYFGDEEEIRAAFDTFASSIVDIRIARDRDTGEPSGNVFVQLSDVETATDAIKTLDGKKLPSGESLKLLYAKARKPPFDGSSNDRSSRGSYGYGRGDGRGDRDRYGGQRQQRSQGGDRGGPRRSQNRDWDGYNS